MRFRKYPTWPAFGWWGRRKLVREALRVLSRPLSYKLQVA